MCGSERAARIAIISTKQVMVENILRRQVSARCVAARGAPVSTAFVPPTVATMRPSVVTTSSVFVAPSHHARRTRPTRFPLSCPARREIIPTAANSVPTGLGSPPRHPPQGVFQGWSKLKTCPGESVIHLFLSTTRRIRDSARRFPGFPKYTKLKRTPRSSPPATRTSPPNSHSVFPIPRFRLCLPTTPISPSSTATA